MTEKQLPKILYRVYGDHDIEDLGVFTDYRWKDRIVILTTTDYGKDKIHAISQLGFEIVPPICTNEVAGENSALILNSGLEYLESRGEEYAFLMSSGFQEKLNFIKNVLMNIMDDHPNRDIYFFLTRNVNDPTTISTSKEFNIFENRASFIPSESLAVVKISSVFPLDEELTRKGSLGVSKDGLPLGGIELPVTVMSLFSEGKTLNMCAVKSILERGAEIVVRDIGDSRFEFAERGRSVEYTPTKEKLARRTETIDKAMGKLGITPDTYADIFQNTIVINEFDYIFGRPSK